MQDNDKYQVLNTKVSIDTYRRIKKLERAGKLNVYQFGQMFWDTIVRYMDDRHNLTPDMERIMSIFEHAVGWLDCFNLADPNTDKTIGTAIYFIFDAEGKKHGARAVLVDRPFFHQWTQDHNIVHIIERTLELTVPERYKRMRSAMAEMGVENLLDFIDRLIMEHADDADIETIRKEFEDADRGDFGQKPHSGAPYKRHHTKTMDLFDKDKPYGEQADKYLADLEERARQEQKYYAEKTEKTAEADETNT